MSFDSPIPVGVRLPLMTGGIRPADHVWIAQAAADLGFSCLWVGDHVVPPTTARDPYPYTEDHSPPAAPDSPWLDPFLSLAWVASQVTAKVRLGTSIFLLPMRNVTLAAKQISTLSWLTERGVSLGIGSGWFRTEYDICGARFDGRGTHVQGQIGELRRLLATGEFPEGLADAPAPMRPLCPEPIEILWGGYSPLAMRIIARHCDGWLPTKCTYAELEKYLDDLRRACDAEDRDFGELRLVAKPGPGPEPGDERIEAESVARYAEMGFHEAMLELPLNPTSAGQCVEILEQVSRRTFS